MFQVSNEKIKPTQTKIVDCLHLRRKVKINLLNTSPNNWSGVFPFYFVFFKMLTECLI